MHMFRPTRGRSQRTMIKVDNRLSTAGLPHIVQRDCQRLEESLSYSHNETQIRRLLSITGIYSIYIYNTQVYIM